MSEVEVLLPKWGLTMTEATVVEWLKAPGDKVELAEPLVEVETEKANAEVEAPAAGVLGRILHDVGAVVEVGKALALLEVEGGAAASPAPAQAPPEPATPPPRAEPVAAAAPAAPKPADTTSDRPTPPRASPVARRVAAELGVDLAGLVGTGARGLVSEADVRRAASGHAGDSAAPGEGELVVVTRAAALGSDELDAPEGRTVCAGFSGDVTEVGPGVDKGLIGSAVAVIGQRPCGRCDRCLGGTTTACSSLDLRGVTVDGGLADAVLLRADEVLPLPDGLSHADAALMHRIALALHAVRRSGAAPGDHVAVVGSTPLALAVSVVASAAGFGRIAHIDEHPACRCVLTESGIHAIAPPEDAAAWDDLRSWLDGFGADVVFECSGTPRSRVAAIELTRPAGSVVLVANGPERVPMDINLLVMGDKRVRGAQAYTVTEARAALELMARSRIDLTALVRATVGINAFMSADHDDSIETTTGDCRATIVEWLPDATLAR